MNTNKAEDLYEILSVDKYASLATIKRAFRQKASKAHPDKGGNVEDFKRIRLAYEVLSDSSKREQYDEKGTWNAAPNNEVAALNNAFVQCFEIVFEQAGDNILFVDIMNGMKKHILEQRKTLEAQVAMNARVISLKNKILENLIYKGQELSILHNVLSSDIERKQENIENANKQFDMFEKLLGMVDLYEFDFAKRDPPTTSNKPYKDAGLDTVFSFYSQSNWRHNTK